MELQLDVRELEPPIPLERILDTLDTMPKKDWLKVRHNREPYPLYNILRETGYAWYTKWQNGECIILIWNAEVQPPDMIGTVL
ncbi:MAG: DUF2249 domain-containing protein [Candidatus Thiodiazotropha sp. L084R]